MPATRDAKLRLLARLEAHCRAKPRDRQAASHAVAIRRYMREHPPTMLDTFNDMLKDHYSADMVEHLVRPHPLLSLLRKAA